jgi:CheY-like chemotaxis protein
VALMDGRIWPESKEGVGSTFYFTARFQVQEDQSERGVPQVPQTARPAEIDPETLLNGVHVLLVDDGEDNRELIRRYLVRTGTSLEIAENGLLGVEKFKSAAFDMVLMDIEMPVMDGYEAVGAIRRFEEQTGAAPTPVFALTAHTRSEMMDKGRRAGFTEILTKPIRRTDLLGMMAKYAAANGAQPVLAKTETAPPAVPDTAPSPFVVHIEEGMEDASPGYLEKRRADVGVYRASLDAGDFDAICKLAHKMKGTGGGYGFPRLTELGAALEDAAKLSDAATVKASLEDLVLYLEKVELVFPV